MCDAADMSGHIHTHTHTHMTTTITLAAHARQGLITLNNQVIPSFLSHVLPLQTHYEENLYKLGPVLQLVDAKHSNTYFLTQILILIRNSLVYWCTKSILYSMGHIKVPVFCKLKKAILPLHETQVIKNGTVSLNGK